jgi:proline utilization trans-activator
LTECLGYLGSSSSLSFSWQIRCFLKRAIVADVPINLVPMSEEETYTMASVSIRQSLSLVDNDLPSREYAKYLSETTLFHLGEIYHIFEKESFMMKLNQFYDEDWENTPLKDLWHVQLLLVIAFGKLFLRRPASSLGPPGAGDFLRALRLQSDVLDLWDDAILRIEVLCLISLYLLTADMRPTAYTFVCVPFRSTVNLSQ